MQFLILVLIAIANSQRGLSFLRNRDGDPFAGVILDPALLAIEPSLEGMDPPDQMIGLDSNIFLDDNAESDQVPDPYENSLLGGNIGLDPTTEADSDLFLANDIACGASNNDNAQLFGKARRDDTSCKTPPVGQAQPSNPSNKDDPFNFVEFLNKRPPLKAFSPLPEICPPEIFGTSIIPVCDSPGNTRIVQPPGSAWCKLYDVYPIHIPYICSDGEMIWCCKEVTAEPVAPGERETVPENEFDKLTQLSSAQLELYNLLMNNIHNGDVCYLQSLMRYGNPLFMFSP